MAIIFTDNFETGDLSAWTAQSQLNGTITVVGGASPIHHGSYSARADVTTAGNNYALTYYDFPVLQGIVYARAYAYFEELVPTASRCARTLYFVDNSTQATLAIQLYNDAGTVKWSIVYRAAGAYTRVNLASPLPETGKWYCLKMHADMQTDAATADGYYEVWINGISVWSLSNVDTDQTTVRYFYAGRGRCAATATQTTIGTTYLDCVVVASNDIGCEPFQKYHLPLSQQFSRNNRSRVLQYRTNPRLYSPLT